jgi:predicted enzyme related to lactoylglutathione lyase
MIKRFDQLDIATSDLADATSTYERNFGFTARGGAGADAATIAIGDARIRLLAGAAVAETIAASGEGLAAIWLEAEDLEAVEAALLRGEVAFKPIQRIGDRRVIAVDPKAANMTPLYIFDRRV